MKKLSMALAFVIAFGAGAVTMAQVHDWHDIEKAHKHVLDSIHELENLRAANYYSMGGHAAKAEQYLHMAEQELNLAVQTAQGR